MTVHESGTEVYDVAVTSSASNRLEVFARRWNNSIGYRYWDGSVWW
jgi:hypothetical protein